jgi:hypothetical protein
MLRTLANVRDLVLSMPESEQLRPQWQWLAELLIDAAHTEDENLIRIATGGVVRVLGVPPLAHLKVAAKKPRGPSVRRGSAAKGKRHEG